MVIFIYGKDTYRSREHLRKLIDRFRRERDPGGYNTAVLDVVTEDGAGRVLESLLAMPFLGARRLAVIYSLLASKQVELRGEVLRRLESGAVPESTVAVFWEEGEEFKDADARKLGERLSKEPYSRKFDALSGVRWSEWLASEGKKRGVVISSSALTYLSAQTADSWTAVNVLEQASAWAAASGRKEITAGDVRLFLREPSEDRAVFAAVDAILRGSFERAGVFLRESYSAGADAHGVVALLFKQWRTLAALSDNARRGTPVPDTALAKQLGAHPFVIQKLRGLAGRYGRAGIRTGYDKLLALDRAGKSDGLLDAELELLAGKTAALQASGK